MCCRRFCGICWSQWNLLIWTLFFKKKNKRKFLKNVCFSNTHTHNLTSVIRLQCCGTGVERGGHVWHLYLIVCCRNEGETISTHTHSFQTPYWIREEAPRRRWTESPVEAGCQAGWAEDRRVTKASLLLLLMLLSSEARAVEQRRVLVRDLLCGTDRRQLHCALSLVVHAATVDARPVCDWPWLPALLPPTQHTRLWDVVVFSSYT